MRIHAFIQTHTCRKSDKSRTKFSGKSWNPSLWDAASIRLYLFHSLFSLAVYLLLFPLTTTSLSFYSPRRAAGQHETVYSVYLSIFLFYDTNVNCFYREKTCFDSAVIILLWVCVGGQMQQLWLVRIPEERTQQGKWSECVCVKTVYMWVGRKESKVWKTNISFALKCNKLSNLIAF